MDGERSDGGGGGRRGGAVGGGEAEVEDEFACAGMLRGSLTSLHSTVERIFMVAFGIGADDLPHGNTGQIWLKLRGPSSNVKAAKLFVKGVVNQEEQQEISYPGALNCIFCGARGLFLDCLIKSTSAHLVVGSPGFLLISGLAEPVVRAYSLITDLVERYKSIQSRRSETGDKGSGETLDSRRAFKALVEKWEDKYILDLLVLPGLVKEILLDLVKDSGLGSRTDVVMTDGNIRARDESEDRWDKPSAITYTPSDPFSAADRWVEGMNEISGAAAIDSFQLFSSSAGARGRADGAQQRLVPSPQEVWEEEQPGQRKILGIREKDVLGEEEEQEPQLSKAHKEFLLLKFFTAMGYTDDVVKRVLAQTGPKEASQILDLVQQEQDRSDRERMLEGGPEPKHKDAIAQNKSEQERNRPCETEHREEEETAVAAVAAAAAGEGRRGDDQVTSSNGDLEEVHMGEVEGAAGFTKHFEGVGAEEKEEGQEEDFVLGVVKKAAASCGYTEQKVAKVYNMLPDRSTHHLLMELQREDSKETDAFREEPREMDDVVLENVGPKVRPAENKEKSRPDDEVPKLTAPAAEPNFFQWADEPPQPPLSQYTSQSKHHQLPKTQTHQIILPDVKGPPMPIYPPALDPPLTNFQANTQFDQTIYWSKQNHSSHNTVSNQTPQSSNSGSLQPPQPGPSTFTRNDTSPTRARERRGFMPSVASSVVVTGEQRFLEGLQMPFELKLTDQPGDPKLRTIIIDGSNVAMSHGLGHFFSCRGIALAVQHFWDRGHRNISALLPQWRQKSDPKTKEQHYLMELQKLGLVSYTPSREVQGKRISSYDDRLMLQLAQKTDGVIVTNDNLRDLSDETPVWRDIIKKRLLQYTFVGDHFMVPDDPLGRGGPHLDDFLRSEHRTPDPGNHSFAGMANTFPSSKSPRSQTEVLNFRDRVLFGGLDSAGRGGGRGRGRGHGNRWDMGHQHRQHGAAGPRPERSLQETANLRDQLCQVFPDQDNTVTLVLQFNPTETDINVLSGLILEQQGD